MRCWDSRKSRRVEITAYKLGRYHGADVRNVSPREILHLLFSASLGVLCALGDRPFHRCFGALTAGTASPQERLIAEDAETAEARREKKKSLNTQPGLRALLPWRMKVVVEAKAIEKFSDANFAQLNSYLHFSSFEVGLLINFHNWPLKDGGIKRLINTKP